MFSGALKHNQHHSILNYLVRLYINAKSSFSSLQSNKLFYEFILCCTKKSFPVKITIEWEKVAVLGKLVKFIIQHLLVSSFSQSKPTLSANKSQWLVNIYFIIWLRQYVYNIYLVPHRTTINLASGVNKYSFDYRYSFEYFLQNYIFDAFLE